MPPLAARSRLFAPYGPIALGALAIFTAWTVGAQLTDAAEQRRTSGEVVVPAEVIRDGLIKLSEVKQTLVDTHLTVVGRVAYDDLHVSHVFSPVTGRVEEIRAKLGQKIAQNDVLALIASPDMGVAQSDVDKARADWEAAQRDLKRQEFLFMRHATSEREVETARDTFRRAVAELGRAHHKLKLLGGSRANQVNQTFRLTATLAGEVVSRNVAVGDEVQGQYTGGATKELFTIADLKRIWVLADLYESDVGRVALGANVDVHVDAVPQTSFVGKIDWLADVLDPNVRTAKMRLAVDNPNGLLKPDMFATLRVPAAGHPTLTVAAASLVHIGNKSFVFVFAEDTADGQKRFIRRPVVVDEVADEERLAVLHGLRAGEQVASVGVPLLEAALRP